MSSATRGRALEHEIRNMFVEKGWSASRGAGSKGEFANWKTDLIFSRITAETERKVYLVVVLAQCKLKGRRKRQEVEPKEEQWPLKQ